MVLDGVELSLDGYSLGGNDLSPLAGLTCEVASNGTTRSFFSVDRRTTTGDAAFDAELEVRTHDEAGAASLLHEELRAALLAFQPKIFFRYANGHVMFSCGSIALTPTHLDVVHAACRRPTSPYR